MRPGGAAVELFATTKEQRFLDDAHATFAAAIARLGDEHGVLKEGGDGDGALFKGVLLRYVGELIEVEPEAHTDERAFVQRQAEAMWAQLPEAMQLGREPVLCGPNWRAATKAPVELAAQLSGVMLLEQMARLERLGSARRRSPR